MIASCLQINDRPLKGVGAQHTGACSALIQLQENESVRLAMWLREERGLHAGLTTRWSFPDPTRRQERTDSQVLCSDLNVLAHPTAPHALK